MGLPFLQILESMQRLDVHRTVKAGKRAETMISATKERTKGKESQKETDGMLHASGGLSYGKSGAVKS